MAPFFFSHEDSAPRSLGDVGIVRAMIGLHILSALCQYAELILLRFTFFGIISAQIGTID